MIENLKKIIELSDCEWIQEKKKEKIKEGDWIVWHNETTDEWSEVLPVILFDEPSLNIDNDDESRLIWLPVGFDPKTGRLQIADLIAEIKQRLHSGIDNFWDIHGRLIEIWGLIVR